MVWMDLSLDSQGGQASLDMLKCNFWEVKSALRVRNVKSFLVLTRRGSDVYAVFDIFRTWLMCCAAH